MAVTISYESVGRSIDKFKLKVVGQYDSALSTAGLTITDPLGVEYTVNVLSLITNDAEVAFTKEVNITTTLASYLKQNFIDGAYKMDLALAFTTPAHNVADEQYFLFLSNAVKGWINLFSSNLLPSNSNKYKLITQSREYIQAAVEFFRLTQFNTARTLLLRSQDLSDYNE